LQPKPGNYYLKLAARGFICADNNNSDSDSDSSSSSSSNENLPRLDRNKITKGEESLSSEEDSSDDESSDEEAMCIAIQGSLGIPVPMPAKKIAHKKTAEDKKPAAKKVTDTKKPTSKSKVTVDTLYGNKMMSGGVTIKQDKATGKLNLIQEFDKEAEEQTPKLKESKSKQNKPTHPKQTNDSKKSSVTEGNKTDDTKVNNPKEQVPLKGESTGADLSNQGKSGSDVAPSQVAQSDPDHQGDKKITAQQWGSRFVHIHHERTAKKVKVQEFIRPESLKDKLIREGKSHPDPKDPRFPQYFKNKAIRPPSQEQDRVVSGDDIDGNLNDVTETPPIAMPHPEVTPKRTGGICSTLTNIFSPGGNNPKDSSPSESSASYVDPDVAEKIVEEDVAETTDPNVNTLENPTADTLDAIKESKDNSTEAALLDGEFDNEHIVTTIKTTEPNASSKGVTPHNEGITEAIAEDPPEDPTPGNEDDEVMAEDESSPNPPEEWTTIIDRRTEQKNKKARKNKEHKQKKRAKLLRRQARHGPAWAQQGGVLPASSDSASGSPRHSSSNSNQNSQSQETHEDGNSSNGSPGDQRGRSDGESHAHS
jgi:hypothetical protein